MFRLKKALAVCAIAAGVLGGSAVTAHADHHTSVAPTDHHVAGDGG